MHTPYDFEDTGSRIVYVKMVDVADLPAEVQAEAGEREHLYAVHDSDGAQLALVANRNLAFALARKHDYAPVPVH